MHLNWQTIVELIIGTAIGGAIAIVIGEFALIWILNHLHMKLDIILHRDNGVVIKKPKE